MKIINRYNWGSVILDNTPITTFCFIGLINIRIQYIYYLKIKIYYEKDI